MSIVTRFSIPFLQLTLSTALTLLTSQSWSIAQEGGPSRPPQFDSVSVDEQKQITFKLFAPSAKNVRVVSSDLPSLQNGGIEMKSTDGLWEAKTAALPMGAYRYQFSVDGLSVLDPRNLKTSESNMNSWSLAIVPGDKNFDSQDVPHGALATITYHSKTLGKDRRAHVYTPPGYEASTESYPVFYLLHGAFDSDHSWSSVGLANVILDNLIAQKKAKPMIVVMPMGHTAPFTFGPGNNFEQQMKDFASDFQNDLSSTIENRYRTLKGKDNRAIAGLSMGGAHTLDIAFSDLDKYSYIGVFSSGVFGITGQGGASGADAWISKHEKWLNDKSAKEGLKLVWFATGKDDFLIETSRATVKMLKDKSFNVDYVESDGGHTWLNWRDYLVTFAPKLFQ